MKKSLSNERAVYESLCATAYCVKQEQLVKAAKLMASAFNDDPSIRYLLDVFKEYNIPLYLETHKKENVLIYTHLGFTTVDISKIPNTDTAQYAMLKE